MTNENLPTFYVSWTLEHVAWIMLLLIVTFSVFSVAIYVVRNFDKALDKPEETVKEDEHANNPGI